VKHLSLHSIAAVKEDRNVKIWPSEIYNNEVIITHADTLRFTKTIVTVATGAGSLTALPLLSESAAETTFEKKRTALFKNLTLHSYVDIACSRAAIEVLVQIPFADGLTVDVQPSSFLDVACSPSSSKSATLVFSS
jgi:hypothetical protein